MTNFCLEFVFKLPETNRNFSQICREIIEFIVKLPEKIEISLKFAWKNRNFVDLDPRPLQISNKIDAADILH